MTALLVMLVALSTYRVTRLLTADEITAGLREWVVRRFGADSGWAYFTTCPWCVSLWLSVPAAWIGLVHRDQTAVQVIGLALAASAVTGLVASVEPD